MMMMIEAVTTDETPINFYQTCGAITQKKANFVLAALRT